MASAFTDAARRCDEAVVRVFGREVDALSDAEYAPKSGADPYEVNGVLEIPDAIQEGPVPEYARFFLRADELDADPVRGDRLTVDEVEYIVTGSRDETEGSLRLLLDKVD